MDFNTKRCHVLLLELSRQMALDEGGLEGRLVSPTLCVTSLPLDSMRLSKITPCFDAASLESYLSCAAIADKHKLEGWDGRCSLLCCHDAVMPRKVLLGMM